MAVPARLVIAALALGAFSFAAVAVALRPDAVPAPPVAEAPDAPTLAPDVTIAGARGPFRLADEIGRTVVLQFAPADSVEAWAALAEAHAHFEAAGAVVLGVATRGIAPESPFAVGQDPDARAAAAFGYTGRPLAVVVDALGRVRGHASPRDAAALYALAAPVLLEADALASPAEAEILRAASTVLVDLRPDAQRRAEGAFPYALVADAAALTARDLPADLGVPLVFVGPDAEAAAARARAWGYGDVEVLGEAGVGDLEPFADEPAPRPPAALPTGPVVRG